MSRTIQTDHGPPLDCFARLEPASQ